MKFKILFLSLLIFQNSFSQSNLENLGSKINSKNSEVRPTISADGKTLYFIVETNSNSPKNKNKKNSIQEGWTSELNSDGTWGQAVKCGSPINGANKDNAIFWTSVDGSKIIIRGTYENGKYTGRGFSFCTKTSEGWSTPQSIKIKGYNAMSVDKYDGVCLTSDGKTMLLYLSEEKNSWLNDIYVSQLQSENEWSTPQKITSDSISIDDYDEIAPYIAADGVSMYFSSDRRGGHGGYDIWMTKRLDDTWMHWSTPVNVGDSVNSNQWEAYFTLDAKAEYAYIATTRNSIGAIDLCKIKLSENQKPKAVTLLQGKVYNADNNDLVSNAEVTYEIEGSNNPVVVQIQNEVFKTVLPYGNKYVITAKGDGFVTNTQTIDLTNLAPYQELHKDLFLNPVKKEIPENISAKDSLSENQNQADKVAENDIVDSKIKEEKKKNKSEKENKQKVGQDKSAKSKDNSKKLKGNKKANTDIVTDETLNQDLNVIKSEDDSKKAKGKKKKDKEAVVEIESSEQSNEIEKSQEDESDKKKSSGKNKKQKNLSDKSETTNTVDINKATTDNIEKGDVFTVNNILFDFAKSDLKKSSYKELNKVVNLMKENDAVKIELSAHTDNVGRDKYNLSLSKARAKSSRKYLISKGISSKRISSKGYGERKPIVTNKTVKGRKQNRRVEIKITSSN